MDFGKCVVLWIFSFENRAWIYINPTVYVQLRKLLHHFPRSYANLQNAHAKIDDGQYLIFVGKILSAR